MSRQQKAAEVLPGVMVTWSSSLAVVIVMLCARITSLRELASPFLHYYGNSTSPSVTYRTEKSLSEIATTVPAPTNYHCVTLRPKKGPSVKVVNKLVFDCFRRLAAQPSEVSGSNAFLPVTTLRHKRISVGRL